MDDPAAAKSFTFSLPAYLYEALKNLADQERRTPSNMVRVILEDKLIAPAGDASA